MKKVDEAMRQKMQSNANGERRSTGPGGVMQNRLSARHDAVMGNDQMIAEEERRLNGGPGSMDENSETPSIVRHGYGVQYWTDGAHYEGQWQYNKAQGQGTFWHAEGDVYTGEFRNDMANGFGEYTHINGSKYKGEFRDDV